VKDSKGVDNDHQADDSKDKRTAGKSSKGSRGSDNNRKPRNSIGMVAKGDAAKDSDVRLNSNTASVSLLTSRSDVKSDSNAASAVLFTSRSDVTTILFYLKTAVLILYL